MKTTRLSMVVFYSRGKACTRKSLIITVMSSAEMRYHREKNYPPTFFYRNQDLKTYLTKYQWTYRNGYFLPRLPDNLREIFYELKGMFNVTIVSIDEKSLL